MTEQEKQMKEIIKNVKYAPFNKEEPTYTVGVQMEDFVFDLITKELSNAGYGDTKQAVREFAEKVKELVSDIKTIDWSNNRLLYDGIDQLVKETCGE